MNDQLELMMNARGGRGPCRDCVVRDYANCQYVFPGSGNRKADLMFVMEEPIRGIDWKKQNPWDAVTDIVETEMANNDVADLLEEKYLSDISYSMTEVWVTYSLKCPPKLEGSAERDFNEEQAWSQCSEYLRRELKHVDPLLVVSLGEVATMRVLIVLGLSDLVAKETVLNSDFEFCIEKQEISVLKAPSRSAEIDDSTYEDIRRQIATRL